MIQSDTLISDMADRIFREFGQPQAIIASVDDSWEVSLWTALEEAGLTLAWVPEGKGGAGVEVKEGFNILEVAGRYAVSVPLAETLLAGWLLARAGLKVPLGPMTMALWADDEPFTVKGKKLYGCAVDIPFRNTYRHLVCVAQGGPGLQVALLKRFPSNISNCQDIIRQKLGRLEFDGVTLQASALLPSNFTYEHVMLMGAAMRAQQMAGSLQTLLTLSVDYAQTRQAFGRPIGKFQVVQQNLARLAGETAAATAAASSAADTIQNSEYFDNDVILEVAAAKIRTGEAATKGTAIAHQVHGAMGFTAEHVLHRYTQRLFAWREDFGTESEWAVKLGLIVAAKGADELWPLVASR